MVDVLAVTCPECGQVTGRACNRGLFAYVPRKRAHSQRYALARMTAPAADREDDPDRA